MKTVFALFFTFGLITSSFAGDNILCKSANYVVSINDIVTDDSSVEAIGNYGINGVINDGADVEISQFYYTSNILSVSLRVDGNFNKFELTATKKGNGYSGKIFTGKTVQNVECTKKYLQF